MKVPSKKPPAIPTVQLLTSAAFDCSPKADAVGAGRESACATCKGSESSCAAHTDAGGSSVARNQIRNRKDRPIAGFPPFYRSGRRHRRWCEAPTAGRNQLCLVHSTRLFFRCQKQQQTS